MKLLKKIAFSVLSVALAASPLVALTLNSQPAYASPAYTGGPDQAGCDNGSTNFTWTSIGITRPVVASMTIDGEAVAHPATPDNGALGVTICPNFDNARKVGLFVYRRSGMENLFDITGGTTPMGNPITSNSVVTITMTNMGSLAQYYSYSLVHGFVQTWTTDHLGASNASLTFSIKPARTPLGTGDSFGFCTATPPHCNAPKSDADTLLIALDMDFNQEAGSHTFAGAYFGLEGAMGGFVEPVNHSDGSKSLRASLGAPHFLADGTTPNTGSLHAFLPSSVLSSIFHTSSVDTSSLTVTRTESDETEEASFSVTPVSGGVIVILPSVTFSSPSYDICAADTDCSDEGDGGGLPEDSDTTHQFKDGAELTALLEAPDGTVLSALSKVASSTLPATDPGKAYPLGLFNFHLTVPSGSTQEMKIHYITDLLPSQVKARKYNATTKKFADIPGAVFDEDTFNGKHVLNLTYSITDGGALDEDGVANGTIVDPVGLAVAAVTAPDTGVGSVSPVTGILLTVSGTALIAYAARRRSSKQR